jgi:hypothetical protein
MPTVEPATRRQELLYVHTCDIWKPDAITKAVDGRPNNVTTYTKIASAQKCYFFTTKNTNAPFVFGRYKPDYLDTMDTCKFPSGVDIDDNYVLKFLFAGDMLNTFWRVQGNAQDRGGTARRTPDFRMVLIRVLREPPGGVS